MVGLCEYRKQILQNGTDLTPSLNSSKGKQKGGDISDIVKFCPLSGISFVNIVIASSCLSKLSYVKVFIPDQEEGSALWTAAFLTDHTEHT